MKSGPEFVFKGKTKSKSKNSYKEQDWEISSRDIQNEAERLGGSSSRGVVLAKEVETKLLGVMVGKGRRKNRKKKKSLKVNY